jgi:hypothetical protein
VGKEFQTVVNIQAGKHPPLDYGFYNISYAKLDVKKPTNRDCSFFHLRHDSYDKKGFFSFGTKYGSIYPASLDFETDKKLTACIKVLQAIEPIFRVETKEELIELYTKKLFGDEKDRWIEMIEKLTSNEPNIIQVPDESQK